MGVTEVGLGLSFLGYAGEDYEVKIPLMTCDMSSLGVTGGDTEVSHPHSPEITCLWSKAAVDGIGLDHGRNPAEMSD